MTSSLSLAISGSLSGAPTGTKTISVPITVTTPLDASTLVTLSSGANTITPPVGATCVCIIPPASNAVTMTLKGVTGDTGVPLSLTQPTFVSLASAASFCLTAGSSLVGVELLYF